VIETSTASLDEFIESSKTRKNPVGKQRHVVDAFRTVAWFNFLKKRCGATSTYQMDQRLENQLRQAKSEERDNKNKWRSYRVGLHTPSTNLVGPIETTYAGGHAVLNHVLWKTLRLDRLITSHVDLWLGELPPEIQGIVYQRDAKLRFEKKICRSLNQTHLSMLERRVGPDALACSIVLLRLAAENGDAHFAQSLSRSICRMLLILGPILGVMGIRTALVQYFEQEILPLSSQSGRHYQFWSKGYLLAAYELNLLANLIEEDENRVFTDTERIALRIDILDGSRGGLSRNVVTCTYPTDKSSRAGTRLGSE